MQIVVLIPTGMADLDEANSGFGQTPSHQALPREVAGRTGLHPVSIEHGLWLFRDVEQLRHLALHLERQFE